MIIRQLSIRHSSRSLFTSHLRNMSRLYSSHSPSLPSSSNETPIKKPTTIPSLMSKYRQSQPITMLTAHDFPSSLAASVAGIDMILVGDSLAMVGLGMSDTIELTLDDMLLHCKSVRRGVDASSLLHVKNVPQEEKMGESARVPFLVGDLPMGSYEIDATHALKSCVRMIKEGKVNGVKLEGGRELKDTIRRIVSVGIPVLGHVGLTPQRQNSLGGFRVQGKDRDSALRVLDDALAVQEAGAFGVVLEAVPSEVAGIITRELKIPTIGIGAGGECSGQVLVQVDMLGYYPPGRFLPKFVKRYGDLWSESVRAIDTYKNEVRNGVYPAKEHTYPITEQELSAFRNAVENKSR